MLGDRKGGPRRQQLPSLPHDGRIVVGGVLDAVGRNPNARIRPNRAELTIVSGERVTKHEARPTSLTSTIEIRIHVEASGHYAIGRMTEFWL